MYILWFPRSVVWRHDPLQFVFSEHAPNCQSHLLTINFSSFHLVRFCHSFTRCELKSFTKESPRISLLYYYLFNKRIELGSQTYLIISLTFLLLFSLSLLIRRFLNNLLQRIYSTFTCRPLISIDNYMFIMKYFLY